MSEKTEEATEKKNVATTTKKEATKSTSKTAVKATTKTATAKKSTPKAAAKTTTKKATATKSTAAKKESTAKPKAEAKKTTAKTTATKKESTPVKEVETVEAKANEVPTKEEAKAEKKDTTTKKASTTKSVPVADKDFDWSALGKRNEVYSEKDRLEMEKMYDKTLTTISVQDVIDGKIVALTPREVVVNIGYKSDGVISRSELRYNKDLKVGDEVEVFIESQEDKNGQLVLSHTKARALRAWERVNEALETQEVIKGYVKCRTKGGLIVDVFGIEAFLPGSQIDVKPIKDYDMYVGTTMDLKVVKLNQQYRNIVVSHKAIIESDLEQQKTEILGSLEKGQVLEGVVKNLTSFGVFVDLGGVDGLIHITDVSWGRINHPEEVLELGQKINCVVLDYDGDKKRISLGLKQLTQHPWETLPEDIGEKSVVKGKVVNIEDYGAFLEIYPGVEGLIHVSEMSWSTHLKSPSEYLNLGDEVEATVLTIDREERKLALGMKQLTTDPWDGIEERYPANSKHAATVRSMTNFGLFMELEEGIDGLVHISDLSWTKKFNHPAEFTKMGEKLEVLVLDIDKDNRRLSLGHKQLEDDPWDTFESIFLNNSVHKGTVARVEDKGAIITLPYNVEAFAPNKHIAKKDKNTRLIEGDSTEFKVLEFDRDNRRIVVSHSQVWRDEERAQRDANNAEKNKEAEQATKAVKKIQSAQSSDTLADANDVLAGLKKDMEKEELKKQKEAMKEMEAKLKNKDSEDESEENESPEAEVKVEEKPEADAKEEQPEAEAKEEKPEADAKEEQPEAEAKEEKPKAASKAKKPAAKKAKAKTEEAPKAEVKEEEKPEEPAEESKADDAEAEKTEE